MMDAQGNDRQDQQPIDGFVGAREERGNEKVGLEGEEVEERAMEQARSLQGSRAQEEHSLCRDDGRGWS